MTEACGYWREEASKGQRYGWMNVVKAKSGSLVSGAKLGEIYRRGENLIQHRLRKPFASIATTRAILPNRRLYQKISQRFVQMHRLSFFFPS